jgi:hypothetical protein
MLVLTVAFGASGVAEAQTQPTINPPPEVNSPPQEQSPPNPGISTRAYGPAAGSVSLDSGSGTATVGANASSGRAGGTGGGSVDPSPCQWSLFATHRGGSAYNSKGFMMGRATGGYDHNGNLVTTDVAGTWYSVTCPGQTVQMFFVPGDGPPSSQMLLYQATAQLSLPAPDVQMSPATTHWQVVQMPTWVWLRRSDWVPRHATATVPGVTVTATAVPVRLELTYEDGLGGTKKVTCNGPGTPYSEDLAAQESPRLPVLAASPDCGWVWHYTAVNSLDEKLKVTASVVYDLSWTVSGAPGGGTLPQMTSPPSTYRLEVDEIQALNVP